MEVLSVSSYGTIQQPPHHRCSWIGREHSSAVVAAVEVEFTFIQSSVTMLRQLSNSGRQVVRPRAYEMRFKSQVTRDSIANPTAFWEAAAQGITWNKPFTSVLNTKDFPHGRWFEGGELNTSYNSLDRHVKAGLGKQNALIYDSPVTDTVRKYTYEELLEETIQAASVLRNLGVQKGDRVIIYMPNIPEAVIAMQACARIGAVHSVVFGGFADVELATRIRDCKPKVVMASSCGIENGKILDYKKLLDSAIAIASDEHVVEKCLIYQRPQHTVPLTDRDIDLRKAMEASTKVHDPRRAEVEFVRSEDPLYVLYTSGTTGKPKGVVRDNGGHAVALHWATTNIYNIKKGDVLWAASDVGWVVGHSFSNYGPLIAGATTLLYEGKPVGTPDAAQFWRLIERHRVKTLFTAPTGLRGIKRVDPQGELVKKFDISSLETLFVAGERADTDTLKWAEQSTGVPVRDHWWQTETGWPITSNLVGLEGHKPVKYGSAFGACPGYDVQILDDAHEVMPAGKLGSIAIKLPLPPGVLQSLFNSHARFEESYLKNIPGYYDTGDAGYIDEDGYVFVMSRTDDVMNVAGHRLSSGAMEEVISDHQDVAEVAVVGVKDPLKGQTPLGLIVLKNSSNRPHEVITQEVVKLVRERIGPVAAFKNAIVVAGLPKTRSGKVLRATMRSIADGNEYKMPATIENPAVLVDVATLINDHIKANSAAV